MADEFDDALNFLDVIASTALTATKIQSNNANIEADRQQQELLYNKRKQDTALRDSYRDSQTSLKDQVNDNQVRLKELYKRGEDYDVNLKEHSKLGEEWTTDEGNEIFKNLGVELIDGFTTITSQNNDINTMNNVYEKQIELQNKLIRESEAMIADVDDAINVKHLINEDLTGDQLVNAQDVKKWYMDNRDKDSIIDEVFFPDGEFTLKGKEHMKDVLFSDKFLKGLQPGLGESLDILQKKQAVQLRDDRIAGDPEGFSQSVLQAFNNLKSLAPTDFEGKEDRPYLHEAYNRITHDLKGTATMWDDEKSLAKLKEQVAEDIINATKYFDVGGNIKTLLDKPSLTASQKNAKAKMIVEKLIAEETYTGEADTYYGIFKKDGFEDMNMNFVTGFDTSDKALNRAHHYKGVLQLFKAIDSGYTDESQQQVKDAYSVDFLKMPTGEPKSQISGASGGGMSSSLVDEIMKATEELENQ